MSRKFVVTKVGNELANALAIREALEGEDPQLILDTIEGETALHEAVCVIVEQISEDEMMAIGIEAKLSELTARLTRIKIAAERMRNIAAAAMDKSGAKTINSPLGTITLRAGSKQIVITDQKKLPDDVFEQAAPRVSMALLREKMNAGQVAGAEWRNGAPSLSIRRS